MEENENLEEIKKHLDEIYFYLSVNMDEINDDEKEFWFQLLSKIDNEFYEYQNLDT